MSIPPEDGIGQTPREPFRRAVIFALIGFASIALLVEEARWTVLAVTLAFAAAILVGTRSRRALRGLPADTPPEPERDEGYAAMLDAMPEPAFLADRRLAVSAANATARQVFGELPEGTPLALRFRSPEVLSAAEEAVETSEPRETDYVERLPVDRSWALDIRPVRETHDGAAALFLFRFRDRTAERRIERMRVDFVANASHELRTPLASILGFIETLQGPARKDPEAQTRFLHIMRQQAERMARLIDGLLSLSRIETKRRLGPDDRADLVEVLRSVHAEMATLALESGVELSLDLGRIETFEVTGDRDELVRVFSNLVENACRYASGGQRAVLGLREERGGAVASVHDFGPGIEERHIPRLTERFYRIDESTVSAGTGLGLSIVRNILVRHGTRLTIRSKLGEGSTFSIAFRHANDMKI